MIEIDGRQVAVFIANMKKRDVKPFLSRFVSKSMIYMESTAKVETPIKDGRLRRSYYTIVR